jgi:hypothetical protein
MPHKPEKFQQMPVNIRKRCREPMNPLCVDDFPSFSVSKTSFGSLSPIPIKPKGNPWWLRQKKAGGWRKIAGIYGERLVNYIGNIWKLHFL